MALQVLDMEEIAELTFQGQYISGVTEDALGLVNWLKSGTSIKKPSKINIFLYLQEVVIVK